MIKINGENAVFKNLANFSSTYDTPNCSLLCRFVGQTKDWIGGFGYRYWNTPSSSV